MSQNANETVQNHCFQAPPDQTQIRVDLFLHTQLPELSRTRIQELIKNGFLTVNSKQKKANYRLRPNDTVSLTVPPPEKLDLAPQNIDIDIIYEDDDLVVINKHAGIVVHPGAGTLSGTIVNAVLHHCDNLSGIGGVERPGIVHRLDKDTSGCLIVAKNDKTHRALTNQFSNRTTQKEYIALVKGVVEPAEGKIEGAIGRNPKDRKKMAVVPNGKPALTYYKTEQVFDGCCLVRLFPKTGRTHQIRVHMQLIKHPLLGDIVYGTKACLSYKGRKVPRQMLHAHKITFTHPATGKQVCFTSPVPNDMLDIINTAQ